MSHDASEPLLHGRRLSGVWHRAFAAGRRAGAILLRVRLAGRRDGHWGGGAAAAAAAAATSAAAAAASGAAQRQRLGGEAEAGPALCRTAAITALAGRRGSRHRGGHRPLVSRSDSAVVARSRARLSKPVAQLFMNYHYYEMYFYRLFGLLMVPL